MAAAVTVLFVLILVLSSMLSEDLLSFYTVFELERKKRVSLGKVTAGWAPELHKVNASSVRPSWGELPRCWSLLAFGFL